MKNKLHIGLKCFLLAYLLVSCSKLEIINNNSENIVVEGWIDNDGYPIVFLSRSIPISTEKLLVSDLSNYIERWAKVSVSDGDTTVVLTGIFDKESFPPFYYTTSRIKGESGKTYTLKIETSDRLITSTTTIPPKAYVDSFSVKKGILNDTLYNVGAYVSQQESNYFQFFIRDFTTDDGYYKSSYLGAYSNDDLPIEGCRLLAVNNYRRTFFVEDKYTTSYPRGTLLKIKISAMEKSGYDFWQTFEKMLSLSRNPICPMYNNLPTNIIGGYGYWIGYGSTEYNIEIPLE
jgi:hypothetical protein